MFGPSGTARVFFTLLALLDSICAAQRWPMLHSVMMLEAWLYGSHAIVKRAQNKTRRKRSRWAILLITLSIIFIWPAPDPTRWGYARIAWFLVLWSPICASHHAALRWVGIGTCAAHPVMLVAMVALYPLSSTRAGRAVQWVLASALVYAPLSVLMWADSWAHRGSSLSATVYTFFVIFYIVRERGWTSSPCIG